MSRLLIFVIFLGALDMQAQPGFNQSYDLGELAAVFCNIERTNDTIIVYGGGKRTRCIRVRNVVCPAGYIWQCNRLQDLQ